MGSESMREVSVRTLAIGLWLGVLLANFVVDPINGDFTYESQMTRVVAKVALPGTGVRFKNNASFKIAMFADLHYGENAWEAWGPAQDVNSTTVQSNILDHEYPDFVVYLGDVITANNLPNHDATQHWQQAVGPTIDRKIPFASVFGNHDDAAFEWDPSSGVKPDAPHQRTTRAELMAFDRSLPNSFSRAGPQTLSPSVSNYVIPIAAPDGTKTIAIMYFLDSGGGSTTELISADQSAWFTSTASEINPDATIPELVFWHIPSIAYTQAGPQAYQPIKTPCVGSINDENIAPQVAEWGIMDVLSSRNSIKAVFVGHNHGLDWCCPCHNMHLCFARHTGYGGYGKWIRGARLVNILLGPEFQIKTWVTLEDGTVTSNLNLT